MKKFEYLKEVKAFGDTMDIDEMDEFGKKGYELSCIDIVGGVHVYWFKREIAEDDISPVELYEKVNEWTSFVKDDNPLIKTIAVECAAIGYRKAKGLQ